VCISWASKELNIINMHGATTKIQFTLQVFNSLFSDILHILVRMLERFYNLILRFFCVVIFFFFLSLVDFIVFLNLLSSACLELAFFSLSNNLINKPERTELNNSLVNTFLTSYIASRVSKVFMIVKNTVLF